MKKIFHFILHYLAAMLSCVYIFTIGIFFRHKRQFIHNVAFHYLLAPFKSLKIPMTPLSAIVADQKPIMLCQSQAVSGNVSLSELIAIVTLIKSYAPKHIFEIGTFDGRTTLNMAINSSDDAKVYTLDLPKSKLDDAKLTIDHDDLEFIDKEKSGRRFLESAYSNQIMQLYGDSASFDFLDYENSMDFIFIDGSHTYDYVRNDTRIAKKLLRDGQGVIVWHDYSRGCEGVRKALNEFYGGDRFYQNMKNIEGTSLVYLKV